MDSALRHLSNNDPIIARLIAQYPAQRLEKHSDYYYQLVSSIIGQQISVHAAKAILKRFIDLFDGTFPTPQQVVSMDFDAIKSAGLGTMKTRYVQDLATKVIDGIVTFDQFDTMSNEAVVEELIKVKGIGEWTAHMFLMFSMARTDILPVGDLGVRNGITTLYGLPTQASAEDIIRIANENNWHPYESIASLYVWLSLENITTDDLPKKVVTG